MKDTVLKKIVVVHSIPHIQEVYPYLKHSRIVIDGPLPYHGAQRAARRRQERALLKAARRV